MMQLKQIQKRNEGESHQHVPFGFHQEVYSKTIDVPICLTLLLLSDENNAN